MTAGPDRAWSDGSTSAPPSLEERRARIDALLDARLPDTADNPGQLVEAMRYSLLAPGKRLRPILAWTAAETVGATIDDGVLVAAAAVELMHCYSLVHDDLPAMDDDDVRRGRPTSHKAFGESTAILAGDALLTLAFEWLADAGLASPRPAAYLRAAAALARGAGMGGMVRGQARDLGEAAPTTLPELERLHAEKTGALFRAALEVGAWVGGGTADQVAALGRFGEEYGIAFQHADDRDDAEHGVMAAEARQRARQRLGAARAALNRFGDHAALLHAMAGRLAEKLV